MQQSLFISSSGHIALLLFMVFFVFFVTKNIENILVPPVKVAVISVSEFDAKLSNAPDISSMDAPTALNVDNHEDQKLQIEEGDETPDLSDISKKIELGMKDEKFNTVSESQLLKINKSQSIVLKKEKQIEMPANEFKMEEQGNEKRSLTTPKTAKPKPRTADRIDKIAVSNSSSQTVVEIPIKAIKASDDAFKIEKTTKAEAPKEAATKIVPEGKKNVEIVVSGALQNSVPPPSRPTAPKIVVKPPVKRPKASDLLKNRKETDQYEKLLSQAQEDLKDDKSNSALVVSIIEQNSMITAIKQKLEKYWDQGILAGNSNFEKYSVLVQVEVNSLGEIVGGVKLLDPIVLTGRYQIAFRQASNAIISAAPLPIVPNKYPNGLSFKIFFDPTNGFSF